MLKKTLIIIGSRGSELAIWQSHFVKSELEKNNKNITVDIKVVKTKGDKILNIALSKIGDKSLFTKELEVALLNKSIDIAVHSLKDLQTKLPAGLILGAVSKRHAVEDVLIAREKGTTIFNIREGAIIATGSLRRMSQLLHIRPDIKIVDIRGNVPSRVDKFIKSKWDGIILARAGVERLKLSKHISSVIDKEEILPAVSQGALGIEVYEDNKSVLEILKSFHDENTLSAVSAERELLRTLEGGCQVPIGAYAEVKANGLYLDAYVGTIDGSLAYRSKLRGSKSYPEKLGSKLGRKLLKAGAKEILDEIYNNVRNK
ncbi:MAG: hydroxymethylbilane synthase [Ignavibacteriaceae bacterium]|nr:hydroxymethylbilane synthase [Ignavibacteriaceae bacterium]